MAGHVTWSTGATGLTFLGATWGGLAGLAPVAGSGSFEPSGPAAPVIPGVTAVTPVIVAPPPGLLGGTVLISTLGAFASPPLIGPPAPLAPFVDVYTLSFMAPAVSGAINFIAALPFAGGPASFAGGAPVGGVGLIPLTVTTTGAVIPEPSEIILLGVGLAGLAVVGYRRYRS